MLKKILIFIFLINLVLFWNLTKVNRVRISLYELINGQITLEYYQINGKQNKIVDRITNGDDTITFRLFSSLKGIKIFTDSKGSMLNVRKITILSTIFPFTIKAENIPKYFEFKNITYKFNVADKYAMIKFNSNQSYISTKAVVWNYIYLIRFTVVVFLALLVIFLLWVVFSFKLIIKSLLKKYTFILCLIFVFVFPLLLLPVELGYFSHLSGVTEKHVCPKFSIKDFTNKSFQKNFESYLNYKFIWNNLYIKIFNTVFYLFFDKSYSENQNIIIGKEKYLYGKSDIYLLTKNEQINQSKINKLSSDLKSIQDYYKSKKKIFIVVITPNKAEFCTEYIPNRFNIKPDFEQKNYIAMVKSFEKYGINLADTPKYIKENAGDHLIFSQGGIHWGDYSKYLGTKLLVQKINETNSKTIGTIALESVKTDNKPQGEDVDLANLLNLLKAPDSYPVEHVQLKHNRPSDLKVNIVGGSFSYGIIEMLNNSKLFNNIEFFYYLLRDRIIYTNFYKSVTKQPTISNDKIIKLINKGDIIILEINQEVMADSNPTHVTKYIEEMNKYIRKK